MGSSLLPYNDTPAKDLILLHVVQEASFDGSIMSAGRPEYKDDANGLTMFEADGFL